MLRWIVGGFVCVGVVSGGVVADEVDLIPIRDTTIMSNGNCSGAGDYLFSGRVGSFGGGHRQRALLDFDVAHQIPAGSTIESVTLTIWLISASPSGLPETHSLHRLFADWGEGTSDSQGGIGAPPTAGDATWTNRFHPGSPWSVSGGDYAMISSGSTTIGLDSGYYTFESTAGLVADVQAWLDGTEEEHGWVMLGNEATQYSAKKMGSREFEDGEVRPHLLVTYQPGVECPADLDGSGSVDFADLLSLLAVWGPCPGCPADIDGSGAVDFNDLLAVLGGWGPC